MLLINRALPVGTGTLLQYPASQFEGGQGGIVNRAADSRSEGLGFEFRSGQPLLTGWVGVSQM